MKKTVSTLAVLLTVAVCHADSIPLSEDWNIHGLPESAVHQKSGTVRLSPERSSSAMYASQRIAGPFKEGEILRFSADVKTDGVKDDKGKSELRPYDWNLNPVGVCLAITQITKQQKPLSTCGSNRLLGTDQTRLEMEITVQQDIDQLELRLLATLVTGSVRYSNMQLARIDPEPLQELPTAKILKTPQGGCFWQVNGKTLPWGMYFGNNQFNHDDRILAEMEKAVGSGVPVLSFNLYLPAMSSNLEQLKVIERFMKPFPNAYFIPRVWLGPGEAYKQSFPEEMMLYEGGVTGDYASASSEHWKDFTDSNLRELVNLIRRSPYAKQFIGLKLTYYQTGEWIYWDPQISAGYGEITRQGFIRWLQEKYSSLEQLNKAWNSVLKSYDEVTVPSKDERDTGVTGVFRDPKTQQRIIDFSYFYNTLPAETICRFAKTVKVATGNKSLTAAFYGYIFELAWSEPWLQGGGHLGLETLYRSPYIDIIGAPYSYSPIGRGFGLPVDLHGPFDAINSYGKTAMMEEDTFTHLAINPKAEDGWSADYAPGYASHTTNMEQTLSVLRRDLGVTVSHNQLIVWQNLFSEGRFNDQKIWDMYKPYLKWMRERSDHVQPFSPQVAVVVDPEAVTLLKNNSYSVTERWLYQNRFFLNRVDTSIGYYLQSDLSVVPDSVRCLVLLNPYRITKEQQQLLKDRFMRDGKMIIFCYMPNIYDQTGFNPDGTDFCGIKLEMQKNSILPESRFNGQLLSSLRGQIFGAKQYGLQSKQPCSPWLTINDPDAKVFATYTSDGKNSCAMKEMANWTSVYLGSSGMPAAAWRELFKKAGCHLYLNDKDFSIDFSKPDFIQANGNFLLIQSALGGEKTVRLPAETPAVYRFDSAEPELIGKNCTAFSVKLDPGIPSWFLIETNLPPVSAGSE